jgi:hypothetical protein
LQPGDGMSAGGHFNPLGKAMVTTVGEARGRHA